MGDLKLIIETIDQLITIELATQIYANHNLLLEKDMLYFQQDVAPNEVSNAIFEKLRAKYSIKAF